MFCSHLTFDIVHLDSLTHQFLTMYNYKYLQGINIERIVDALTLSVFTAVL